MDITDILLSGRHSTAVNTIGSQFGLSDGQTAALLQSVVPALGRGLLRNAQSANGIEALTRALANGNHQRYLDEPRELESLHGVTEGNAILGHIFGSKDVSRNVAALAAKQSGVDYGIVKSVLPLAAAAVMGVLSQQRSTAGGATAGSPGGGLLSSLLDSSRGGSSMDEVLNLATTLFRR